MAGNGALDLSIRIMGKVDPSLAKSISQVKGLTNSLTGGLRTTNSLASTVANTVGLIGKAGLGLAATLTGSVLVGMKQVTNEASKLEAQMAPVVRYVNGLADASGKVSDAIADNGKTFKQNYSDMENYVQRLSMDIPRTTEQLTTMSAALGQSGKDVTEQTQTGILRDTAVAATAMDLDDQTAGDYMAKWEASFTKRDADGNKVNYSHDDVMRLMNQINFLGANNATTAAEIASSVNKSASIGQLAGVDPSTTAAIATAMQATGVDTERTGTTISRIYTNISKGSSATKAQKEMWEELGFTAEGVAKSMQKDGTGTLMKVFGAVNQLPDERKIAALNTLFNQWAVEGSAKVTNNLDLLMKTLSEVSDEAAYANSMEREFAINTGTEESLRTMRDNAKTVLMQDLGDSFLPAQKELTRLQLDIYKGIDENLPDLSNLANSILPLLRTAVEGIGGAVQGALPWIQQGIDYLTDHGPEAAGAIGAILATLAAMSMAPTAYSAGSTALSVVKNLTLGGKASGAPGGKFGGITVGNLLGILSPTSLFQNTVSGSKGLWDNRGNILKSAKMGAWMANSSGQGGIAGRLGSLAGGVIGALNSDALTSGKKKPMQAVAGKIFGAAGYINNVANIPTNAQNAMKAVVNSKNPTIRGFFGAGLSAAFGKNGLNLPGAGMKTLGIFGKLGGGFMSLLGTFGPAITSLGTMVAVVSLLGDHFEDVRNIVGQIFGEGGLAVFDAFTRKISGIGDTIKQVFGQLTTPEGLQSIQEKLSNFSIGGLNLGDVFGAAMPAIQTVMPLIQSFAGVFGQIVDLGVNHIKPLLVEIFGFVVNQGIPAVMPLLSTVVSLVGTILVNAIKTVVDVIGKLLPVVEPVVLGIIGLVKGIVGVVVNVVNAIIRTLNKINFTVPDWVPALGGKQFGFNLTEVTLPKFADGGFTSGPSLAGEAGTEAIISFRRSQREQNVDTWLQAGKMLGVPLASAMIQGSDFGVAFRRTTEIANYAADALEGAAASGNATAQKVLDNSRVQQALSFARRADVAQAQLERLFALDGYDLSNLTFFPTAGDAALTRQNLTMLENLRDRQQEVEVPSITGDNGTNSGSGQPGGTGGYQRSYTSSSGNTYVYAPNFIIYGSMDPEDLRSLMDDGYERFCEYVEKYERERKRMDYGT
jgi:TP901 family phage tail tape measure protein|nr:MAG: minor tail protein [Bacteriophage sp.]